MQQMATPFQGLSGAAYLRISDDSEGLAIGVTRQRQDVIELAEQHGIDLPDDRILEENDVGASTRSRKRRPQYETLKRWVQDGTVKYVLFYSNSRLTRRPMEMEEWIALHEQTGVRLLSKVSGNDDLGTADGRMVARIKASVDAAEAERTGERIKRAFEHRRAQGMAHHGPLRPFGFASNAGQPVIVPAEAEAIRHGARMLIAGATLGAVAREWDDRGIAPPQAKAWTRQSVRGVYNSPRVAGLVAYQGKVVAEGAFPAILDRATWEAARAAMQRGPARPPGYGARVHELSGFVFCGTCGSTMVVQGVSYACVKARHGCGGVRRNKAWLDARVDGEVRGMLSHAGPVELEAAEVAPSEADAVEARIEQVREQYSAGQLDDEDFFPLLSGLRARLKDLRRAEAEQVRVETQNAALSDPMQVWEDGTLTEKRALLASLVKGIYVMPVGRIGRAPLPIDSVKVVPT